MILENTFTSIEKLVSHFLPSLAVFVKFILKEVWATDEKVPELKCPMLFIKCRFFLGIKVIFVDFE